MEPPSALAIGFDTATDQRGWRIAEEARDDGRIAASPPFRLIEDAGKPDASPVVALYAPVYREGDPGSAARRRDSLSGFAVAIVRIAPMVRGATEASGASGLGLTLKDLEAREAPWLAQLPKDAAGLPRRPGFELQFPLLFAGRRWALDVFALPDAYLPSKRTAIGAASVAVTAALLGLATVTWIQRVSRRRR